MTHLRIADAAALAGVSQDTVRRLVENDVLPGQREGGRITVDSLALGRYLQERASEPADPTGIRSSARNRMVGIVVRIKSDEVMSQVDVQCGSFTVCSLMSTESVRDLGLEPGSVAVAVVKSTQVILEVEGTTP